MLVYVVLFVLSTLPALVHTAEEGSALYRAHCSECHGADLNGSAHGNALVGRTFRDKWTAAGASELLAYQAASMPPGNAAFLSDTQHLALVQFMLTANQMSTDGLSIRGETPADEPSAFDSWSQAGSIDAIAKSRSAFVNRTVVEYRPVTQAMLNDPPAYDWLSWRRTLDGQGYSPLDKINSDNVSRLRFAWSLAMRDGSNQGTPLIHDGVLYLTHPDNVVQAVNGASGEVIWEYAYPYPPAARTLGGPQRNIAIYEDRIILATYDAALVAIDAKNGKPLWRTVKADWREGYTHTSGPIVGNGVIFSGINGC